MNFSTIFLFQIIITLLFTIVAAILDVRKNFVPDRLTYALMIFGIASNGILSLFSGNIKFILASFISMSITFVITYMLWKLNMWGGGDVKLFTGIASAIPFGLNIDFLNIFPQLSIYPFSFSVVVNSILVSFPFLVMFLFYLLSKNKVFHNNTDFMLNIFNLNSLSLIMDSTMNRQVKIKDLKEGMIINDYGFDNEWIATLVTEMDGNLKVYKSGDDSQFKYYFKSQSAGGITFRETMLLKIMHAQGFISDCVSVKISYPFTPAILFGLMIAIFYGDMMMLFTKNLFLVV